jgi:hypothetical protein
MNLQEINAMTPDESRLKLAQWALSKDVGVGDARDLATMVELDEGLLLQPVEYDPNATTGYPQCDSATGEFCYEDDAGN